MAQNKDVWQADFVTNELPKVVESAAQQNKRL